MPEPIQNALLALAFLACGGLHIVLRLLSLHLCNEYPSLPKKKKKKKKKKNPTMQSGTGEKLELICDLSASYPVALFW